MEKPFSFRSRLQELIDLTGLKNTDIAKIAGVNRSNITHYLSGETEARADIIYKISNATGVDPAWLMGYDVPMSATSEPVTNGDINYDDVIKWVDTTATKAEKLKLMQKLADDFQRLLAE